MFRVLFLEIYHLSILRNPPYLKAEIYILNHKKITKKLKFQWKFLIVKRKFFQNFAPEPRKIGIFKYFILTVFLKKEKREKKEEKKRIIKQKTVKI